MHHRSRDPRPGGNTGGDAAAQPVPVLEQLRPPTAPPPVAPGNLLGDKVAEARRHPPARTLARAGPLVFLARLAAGRAVPLRGGCGESVGISVCAKAAAASGSSLFLALRR
jgi:hypothetical protein